MIDKLQAALSAAMQSIAVRHPMESVGFVVPTKGSRAYTQFVKCESDGWSKGDRTPRWANA